jgi:hypothetical protein
MAKKKKLPRVPRLTQKKLMDLVRQGARNAEELDKTLRRIFTLTPAQLQMRLD